MSSEPILGGPVVHLVPSLSTVVSSVWEHDQPAHVWRLSIQLQVSFAATERELASADRNIVFEAAQEKIRKAIHAAADGPLDVSIRRP